MNSVAFLAVAVFVFVSADFNIDDGILFRVDFDKQLAEDAALDALDEEVVMMTTSDSEKYACSLPKTSLSGASSSMDEEGVYSGPSALELLQQLFVTSSCAYRLEHYWTYELCHGKHARQFHEERDPNKKGQVKLTEYYLGKYDVEKFEAENAALKAQEPRRKPPKKRIETLNMPYYELVMDDGTICDLNGRPRLTRVHYVCYPAGKHEMYTFKESSTCEYDVIVLSPLLCKHPDFRPEESEENRIRCRPLNEDAGNAKPAKLVRTEVENEKFRTEKTMYEGHYSPGEGGPGRVKIEIKQVRPDDSDFDDDEELESHKDANWPNRESRRQPFKPLMDPGIVRDFLAGEYCLYGGTGWWKYEFCYGRKVHQYHEESREKKTVINLGSFDAEKHIAWLERHPAKRPKPLAQRKHVSHFYGDGDVCDVTSKPRSVEVKLKCKHSESPSTVSLYLMEPRTCEYVLGVESPLVCDILHEVDDATGLMLDQLESPAATVAPTQFRVTEDEEEDEDKTADYDFDGYAMYEGEEEERLLDEEQDEDYHEAQR